MYESLDEQYLTWLYSRIGSIRETRKSRTFWQLIRAMRAKEFVWLVANDDNRGADGKDLRYEFLEEAGLEGHVDPEWLRLGCSVIEMVMGVAKRLAFEDDRTFLICFWELMNNLGLSGYHDREFDARQVDRIMDNLIWRRYEPDGTGGLFPLRHPHGDQRHVEIWYQMSLYILEDR